MKELRKNNLLHIKLNDGTIIDGIVSDYEEDRVLVLVDSSSVINAKNAHELDEVTIKVETVYGIKTMYSCVISEMNKRRYMIVENTEAESVEQKRDFVRAVDNFAFKIKFGVRTCEARCNNISGSGIAFTFARFNLDMGQQIKLMFPHHVFEKEFECRATIVKTEGNLYAAIFDDINEYDRNRIIKRIFKQLTKK